MIRQANFIFLIGRGFCLKSSAPFSHHMKSSKCIIPFGKLLGLWKPKKSHLFTFYSGVLRCTRSTSKSAILFSMAFFTPSVLSLKDEKEKNLKEIFQNPQTKFQRKNLLNSLVFNIYETIRIILRSIRLFATFIPIILLYPISYFDTHLHNLWWKILLTGIELSGPIFIKFGQWASTRRDLFPESCTQQFTKLQRRTKPHSWHYTKWQLVKAFGKEWRKIFVKFDNNSQPIGSGCIAQVYKVWMNDKYIKNQTILQEIIQEQDDCDSEKIGFLDDGLEVLGLHQWLWSSNNRWQEDSKSVSELLESKEFVTINANSHKKFDHLDVQTVSENLANEILLSLKSRKFSNKEKDRGNVIGWKETEQLTCDNEQFQCLDEQHFEHALAEQWYSSANTWEKSLSTIEEAPDNLEGLVPVALKVLHPGVYRTFRRDMKIFHGVAWLVTAIYPPLKWLALNECLKEFFEVMAAQIDLREEADNLDAFIETFKAVDTVRFPRPVRPFVTKRILVETFEEGDSIARFIADPNPHPIKKNLAKIGVDALLKMIFVDNLVHGDLHPGNILVQHESPPASTAPSPAHDGNASKYAMVDVGGDTFVVTVVPDPNPLRICILDCGIVARLKPADLAKLKAVFHQVLLSQGDSVASLFLENSHHECHDPALFRQQMNQLVADARSGALTLEKVDVGILLQNVLGILLRHRIRLESAFSAVVLAVFVLEGLGRSLDPEMDILERARPLLI